MLRTRLLTATAVAALFTAPAALAQTAPTATAPAATTQAAPAQTPAAAPTQTPAAGNTVVDVLRAQGQFSTLLSALEKTQLLETLSTRPAISIFAPTDAAFAALPEADRNRLMDPANVNELRQVLLYHVIVADVNSSQITGARGGVATAATTEVQLDGTGESIKVDEATVVQADIDASNGAIFAIDRVLNPATSQVAAGDAEEAEAAAPADDAAATGSTAADDAATTAATPADETSTEEGADAMMDDGAEAATTTAPIAATTATTTPAAPGTTAPSGQPATSTTTVASPPVPNPTDGQQDDPSVSTPPVAPSDAGDGDDDSGSTTPTPPTR